MNIVVSSTTVWIVTFWWEAPDIKADQAYSSVEWLVSTQGPIVTEAIWFLVTPSPVTCPGPHCLKVTHTFTSLAKALEDIQRGCNKTGKAGRISPTPLIRYVKWAFIIVPEVFSECIEGNATHLTLNSSDCGVQGHTFAIKGHLVERTAESMTLPYGNSIIACFGHT